MSTKEILIREIEEQPEPVLNEILRYLRYLKYEEEEHLHADILPGREIEQEVLDILDDPAPR